MKIMLKNVRIAFPALAVPQAFGEGEPAYGAKLVIVPKSENEKVLDDAIAAEAKDKWKDKAGDVLKMLLEDKKVAFVKGVYRSKKTGEAYAGFENAYHLSARNAKTKPTVYDRFGNELAERADIERVIYSGCYVNASVDIWAQDNKWGRRVNCSLRGLMFAADGENFGGSSTASADEFKDFAASADEFL